MLMLQMHLTFTFVAGQVPWLIRPIVGAVVSGVQVSRLRSGLYKRRADLEPLQTTYINVQVQQMVDLASPSEALCLSKLNLPPLDEHSSRCLPDWLVQRASRTRCR